MGIEDILTLKEKRIAEQIRLMLGGSVVKVELSDKDIRKLIDIAMTVVSPYVSDYRYITLSCIPSISLAEQGIEEVVRVMPAYQMSFSPSDSDETYFDFASWKITDVVGTNLGTMTDVVRRKVTPDVDIPFEFDAESRTLMVKQGVVGSITIECIPEVYSVDDIIDKATFKWIYLYTLALAKEVVGRIRSKAKSQNIPIELDGDTLLSESASEKSALESSLLADQTGPIMMIR